jgi:AbrB family looped-hinge helix DNA binding protein
MNTRVSSRGRLVIPIAVRRKLNIKASTPIHIEIDKTAGQIILIPITRQYMHSLRGKYKRSGLLKALMKERQRGV